MAAGFLTEAGGTATQTVPIRHPIQAVYGDGGRSVKQNLTASVHKLVFGHISVCCIMWQVLHHGTASIQYSAVFGFVLGQGPFSGADATIRPLPLNAEERVIIRPKVCLLFPLLAPSWPTAHQGKKERAGEVLRSTRRSTIPGCYIICHAMAGLDYFVPSLKFCGVMPYGAVDPCPSPDRCM